ncbi:undecaprenyldiphospho-muramoylpentapeptide beta-N-acetylglucosaminyltransferase [Peptoniphilus catoniae]|uniref:undecaprenyldiphospho-muramoylpentapeptide beta-N-acetylglucosaminyltransferase n=1 Tax=Peptoniphilus catoniae TaxID=1660341 RepID=UPI0010FDDD33|nr:undecaprenyldiphospho-muramoylpentapeptide beta-N-acetylglucosaminyltransferase [Peptoniphilus catoniae]
MRYILSGGGTGGHIYPALAIISEIKKRNKDAEILYVGKKGSLEEELVTKEGIKFSPIEVKGLPRKKINKDTVVTLMALLKGLRQCEKIIKEFKPDVVIGTGGYVCAPILLKAQQKKILTVIQEQNAYPGKTNRILSKKADLVAVNFEEAKKYLKYKKMIVTGNPIRDDFNHVDREKARKSLGIKDKEKFVLSFGGSGGQESTNEAIIGILKGEYKRDFKLYHVTGKDHYQGFMKAIDGIDLENVNIVDYSNNVPELIMASDLVIASSSAMTLAEISAVGVANILIPKAYTAGNHQVYNANSYKDKKASYVILEEDLNSDMLYNNIEDILKDNKKREEMANNVLKLGNKNAVKNLVDGIELLINERTESKRKI